MDGESGQENQVLRILDIVGLMVKCKDRDGPFLRGRNSSYTDGS